MADPIIIVNRRERPTTTILLGILLIIFFILHAKVDSFVIHEINVLVLVGVGGSMGASSPLAGSATPR